MLGCATRLAAVAGMGLLALYYLAHPPLFAPAAGVAEGSYLIVNKNVVEMLALLVVATFSRGRLGLDPLSAAGVELAAAAFGPGAAVGKRSTASRFRRAIPKRWLAVRRWPGWSASRFSARSSWRC
jgi:hypothetical protein